MIAGKKKLLLYLMQFELSTYYHSEDLPDLPGSDVFYGKEIFQVYEKTPGYSPVLVVAYEARIPQAKLLAVTRCGNGLGGWLIRRCEVFGTGEYFCHEPSCEEFLFGQMLKHLTAAALKKSWLVTFRNLKDPSFGYKTFRENQYFPINWMRVLNNLHRGKDLMQRASPSRRRQIKHGLKSGVTLEVATDPKDIKAFSEMLRRNYSVKVRKHFPSIEFFSIFNEIFPPRKLGNIYIVRYHDHIIGGSVVVFSKDKAYLIFSGGMNKSYKKKYPGVLSVWKALNEAADRGCQSLEYLDAGLPFRSHGFREFALRFGAKTRSSRRWFCFRWAWLNKLLTRIYS